MIHRSVMVLVRFILSSRCTPCRPCTQASTTDHDQGPNMSPPSQQASSLHISNHVAIDTTLAAFRADHARAAYGSQCRPFSHSPRREHDAVVWLKCEPSCTSSLTMTDSSVGRSTDSSIVSAATNTPARDTPARFRAATLFES